MSAVRMVAYGVLELKPTPIRAFWDDTQQEEECATCKEVCVKVYPQGGGREWVVIPPETAKFHGLVAHGEPE